MSDVVTIVDRAQSAHERVGAHRGSGIPVQSLPFDSDGHGFNLWASIGTMEDGYFSPRHHHNFDQIRFMLRGATQFSDWQLEEGCVGYFPESVAYGPQQQSGDAEIFTLQLSGASGRYYPLAAEVRAGNAELKAKDPSFGNGGVGIDVDGVERDSFEILWEHLTESAISYAEPRYDDVVVMRPESFDWTDADGYLVKPLGSFTEYALQVEMARLEGPCTLRAAVADQAEIWLQTTGRFEAQDTAYDASAAWQFLPGSASVEVTAAEGAEFLVVRLPRSRPQA